MVFEFRLPDIGEGVHEGEVVKWLVKAGERVKENQDIAEVMTDKATVQISSPRTGTIKELRAKEGQVIHVGDVFVVIEEADAAAAPAKPEPAPAKAAPKEEKEEKTLFDLPKELGSGPRAKTQARAPSAGAKAKTTHGVQVMAMPKVRQEAKEAGVDLSQVTATGAHGHVTAADLARHAAASAGRAPGAPTAARFELPTLPTEGVVERKGFSPLRKRIAENLVRSKQLAPHYTYVVEIDAERLVALRDEAKGLAEESGVKLTFMPFLIKAVVHAVRKHPTVNANIDEERQEVVTYGDVNVGVAVATTNGLVVPVVKRCQAKSVLQIAKEVDELAARAREGKAKPDDFKGGTFTITSLGKLGGLLATPIISHPQVAIMGVHAIREEPVVKGGAIVVGKRMNLSFSFDHRVIDGYDGARFAEDLVRYLEDPNLLLLESL